MVTELLKYNLIFYLLLLTRALMSKASQASGDSSWTHERVTIAFGPESKS
jgi:hypothetical protein